MCGMIKFGQGKVSLTMFHSWNFNTTVQAKNKSTEDNLEFVAELLRHAPEGYLESLRDVFHHASSTGQTPLSWQITSFKIPVARNLHRTSVLVRGCVCCANFLPTSCWVGWKIRKKIHI